MESNANNQKSVKEPQQQQQQPQQTGAQAGSSSNLFESSPRQRRPANGFLGFCHVHRVIVSRKNKKIENRLVTKILGNWWATLTDEQKAPYEERARQFKDLFLAANPGFKWYTPRESTGNTPVTRQSNRRGRKLEYSALTSANVITPGKLADVSQMGGLNSLMSQPPEAVKKKLVCETSYIASEHDYLLKSPIVNNNTIQAGESLPCTNGGCSHPADEQQQQQEQEDEQEVEMQCTNGDGGCEETTEVKKEEKEVCTEVGAAKKRKGSTPKKNDMAAQNAISLLPAPHNLSFKDYMKACPVYKYDDYLQKKADFNKSVKKGIVKRRKRQAVAQKRSGALLSSGDEANGPDAVPVAFRRRKKGRIGRGGPGRKENGPEQLRGGIELLLTAAETLEN